MTFRKHCWLLIPLAAALGCASSQPSQKVTKAGNSTLVDEGPGSGAAQGAATAQATGQPAAPQLVPYRGTNGYTVLMPPNPERNDRTQDTPGGPVQVHVAQAQDLSGKYMSSLSEFPAGSLDRLKSKDLLDSLQQATIQSMGGTLVSSHDVDGGGLPGREFTATDPGGSEVTARVFVGDSRVYTLAGTYPKGQMPGSVQQFLASFQPPAGRAVGGSGAADTETEGNASGGSSASGAAEDSLGGAASDGTVTAVPAEPTRKSKKRSRRSSSSSSSSISTESSADTGSGSR